MGERTERHFIGPFALFRTSARPDRVSIHHGLDGGPMPLSAFTEEVCPWDQVENADEDKVAAFYGKYF